MKLEPIYIENLARNEILKSNNPMGVDWEVMRYTTYNGVMLIRKKGQPDQLRFLQKYRGRGRKFSKPVIHSSGGHFFRPPKVSKIYPKTPKTPETIAKKSSSRRQ